MRRRRLLAPILILLSACVANPALAFKRTNVGDALEDFSFRSLGQETVTFSASLGRKATLLLFWATWSPRSIEALSDFQKLYSEHGPTDLQVVALNVDKEDLDAEMMRKVEATASALGLHYPVAIDENLTLFERFGVVAVPSIVLTDPTPTIVGLLDGYSNMTRPDFRDKVLETLGVKPPAAEANKSQSSEYKPKGKSMRYYQMGKIFWRKGMRKKAAESFERAVAEDPNHTKACKALTRALQGTGRFEDAEGAHLQLAKLQDSCSVEGTSAAANP